MTQRGSNWRDEALCASLSPSEADDIFFIGPGKSSKRAKLFCASCPVKSDCSNFAVMYNENGIWAGTTDEDRKNLDPFISTVLRAQAEAEGRLESRNLNDFIPQVRHQTLTGLIPSQPMAQEMSDSELLEQRVLARREHEAELLEALIHPFDETNAPQDYAL